MADTSTTSFVLTKPEVGASRDTWGPKLNTNFDRIDDVLLGYYTAGGTGNAVTITTGLSLTSIPTGMEIAFLPPAANSGAMTINVDGIGAQATQTVTGAVLPADYTRTTAVTRARWNGTHWICHRIAEEGGTIASAGGRWVRREDGTQIIQRANTVASISTAIGSNFRSAAVSWTFPKSFVNVVAYTVHGQASAAGSWVSSATSASASAFEHYVLSPTSIGSTTDYYITAQGFWY